MHSGMNSWSLRALTLRNLVPVMTLVSIALVSGCSNGSGSSSGTSGQAAPSVASVRVTGAASNPVRTIAPAERPLIRLDTSEDELARMMKAYARCLRSKGGSAGQVAKTTGYGAPAPGDFTGAAGEKFKTAQVACASKEPEYHEDRRDEKTPALSRTTSGRRSNACALTVWPSKPTPMAGVTPTRSGTRGRRGTRNAGARHSVADCSLFSEF
jgi:hypothetical protein